MSLVVPPVGASGAGSLILDGSARTAAAVASWATGEREGATAALRYVADSSGAWLLGVALLALAAAIMVLWLAFWARRFTAHAVHVDGAWRDICDEYGTHNADLAEHDRFHPWDAA